MPVLLLGEPAYTADVRQALASLRVPVREARSPADLKDPGRIDVAILVGTREDQARTARLLRTLRSEQLHRVLLIATVDGSTDADSAPLYRAGAAGVFACPDEAAALRETLRELLDAPGPAGSASEIDRTLEREIRERLRLAFESKSPLRVKVRDRVAIVAGRIDGLWEKRRVDTLISQIPGIRAVALRELEVTPSGLSDGEIARALRALLRGASSIDDRTLAVTVHDGHAVVNGTVVSNDEWEHIRELIVLAKGVRSVTDQTVAAPKRKRSDRHLAHRIEGALRVLVPDSGGVRAAALGRIVVLHGTASRLAIRREAERIAHRDPSVERVVNKIEVEAPASS